ncbi:hypothetical protein HELRODRAFT_179733 [Helobdella robusta]|uniref:CUB domain-containing protein n=1 Tax=Helobdella robusta TaxID=6412 RepID=T1FF33_HELRO|nr:hypothetical protein HELRODRAFT_179733 [Helobdella robusta]ESN95137.1 hypothetical protein HELRODRAFT_179733 [Helobdella robusta]
MAGKSRIVTRPPSFSMPLKLEPSVHSNVCEAEDFEASCASDDDVVVIEDALLGMMEMTTKCVVADYGARGCSGDATTRLDYFCSAQRQACDSCQSPTSNHAHISGSQSGYITSSVTIDNRFGLSNKFELNKFDPIKFDPIKYDLVRCGGKSCPWRIEVNSGQTINLTLYDFGVAYFSMHHNKSNECYIYGQISEPSVLRSHKICGGRSKVSVIYNSVSNVVDVINTLTNSSLGQYVIYYEANGCSDYVPPDRGWAKRYNDRIVVGCNSSTSLHWEVTCVNRKQQRELMYPSSGPIISHYLTHEPHYDIDLDPKTIATLNTIQRKKHQQQQLLLQQQQQLTLDKKLNKKNLKIQQQQQKKRHKSSRSLSDGSRNVYARTKMEFRPLPSIPVSQGNRPIENTMEDYPYPISASIPSLPPSGGNLSSAECEQQIVHMPPTPGFNTASRKPAKPMRTSSNVKPLSSSSSAAVATSAATTPSTPQHQQQHSLPIIQQQQLHHPQPPKQPLPPAPTQHYTMLDPIEVQQLIARLPQQQQQQIYPQYHPLQLFSQPPPLQPSQPPQSTSPPPQQQHLQFPPPPPPLNEQGVALRPCREGSQQILNDSSQNGTSSWP